MADEWRCAVSHGVQAPERAAQVGRTGGVLSWLVAGAVVGFVIAAWKIGIWANHWYIAERFYYAPDVDEAAKTGPYWDITQLLRSGNQALLTGFCWMGVALLCVGLAVVVRRRRINRRMTRIRLPI